MSPLEGGDVARVHQTPGAFPASPAASKADLPQVPQSLSQAVKARKNEFLRKQQVKIKVGTWNVASRSGTENDLGAWFIEGLGVKGLSDDMAGLAVESSNADLTKNHKIEGVAEQENNRGNKVPSVPKGDVPAVPGGSDIDLYVLGLQEIVDIASPTEALKPYTDPGPAKRWKQAMEYALPPNYQKVAEQQLLGLLILIYASPKLSPSISCVSTSTVGTGLMGYLGNKGAASVRLVLGETTKLVFVNCHLAAGSDSAALSRRIWDTNQILSRTRFAPITDADEGTQEFGDTIGDEDHAFWFGDLNYRLDDIPGDDVRRLLLLHTRNEYDIENKSKRKIDSELGYIDAPASESLPSPESFADDDDDSHLDPKLDPASLHTTLQSLLSHDQLRNQQKLHRAFHEGWQEGEINFLPTYKYDVGSVGMFDSGEKKRSPSWCDRILFRSRKHKSAYEQRLREEKEARKRDEEMKARGLEEAISEHTVLFDYNPDEDGLAYGDDYDETEEAEQDRGLLQIPEEKEDALILDHYISHQRVLSSDHKPLEAIFTLTFDAVDPELKSKVHQEVARELDKVENEGRPSVTVVVDDHSDSEHANNTDLSAVSHDLSNVEFGPVRYDVPKSQGLVIANTGQIPATFGFVDRPASAGQKTGIAPAWLQIEIDRPSKNANENDTALKEYSLPPGETTYVTLTVHVWEFSTVHQLNVGKLLLDDVLVLRIVHGRDHFIPVRCAWMQSCFCRTLDELIRIPAGGIRHLQEQEPQALINDETGNHESDGISSAYPIQHSAPRELFALTESIQKATERCVAEWDMIQADKSPPWKREHHDGFWPFDVKSWTLEHGPERRRLLALVRECLDTGSPVSDKIPAETSSLARIEIFAETLLTFLSSLRDGIISAQLWSKIHEEFIAREKSKESLNSESTQTWVMEIMSSAPVHNVSLTFIIFMLTFIINHIAPADESIPMSPNPTPKSPIAADSSGDPEGDGLTSTAVPSSPSAASPARTSFLPSLRRRRIDTRSSTGTDVSSGTTSTSPPGRDGVRRAYANAFANLIIRSDRDDRVKGKDKRTLHERKVKILEALLTVYQ